MPTCAAATSSRPNAECWFTLAPASGEMSTWLSLCLTAKAQSSHNRKYLMGRTRTIWRTGTRGRPGATSIRMQLKIMSLKTTSTCLAGLIATPSAICLVRLTGTWRFVSSRIVKVHPANDKTSDKVQNFTGTLADEKRQSEQQVDRAAKTQAANLLWRYTFRKCLEVRRRGWALSCFAADGK